jgi:hypothetical protein
MDEENREIAIEYSSLLVINKIEMLSLKIWQNILEKCQNLADKTDKESEENRKKTSELDFDQMNFANFLEFKE